jgi:outer membrane protease
MKNTMFVKAAAFLLLFAGLTAGASAQITISGGFALSMATLSADWEDISQTDTIGLGGNVYADYLLPISIPLSLGLEVGVDSGTTSASDGFEDTILAIPLLVRVAYHLDLMPKLDLYAVGKIGYAFGNWSGDTYDLLNENDGVDYRGYKTTTPSGFAFGFDIGAAYYFTSRIGVFIEAGFDRYLINAKTSGQYNNEEGEWISDTLEINLPFTRFFTVGVSTKF